MEKKREKILSFFNIYFVSKCVIFINNYNSVLSYFVKKKKLYREYLSSFSNNIPIY